MNDQPLYTNRLIHQKSPYLLQHAHNPVDWYPWSEEAFEEARRSNKPIFLSIGYATCHWCHVMEKESFQNIEIAQLLNQNFINIKIDREELPDIDSIYLEFAQGMTTGAVGWPLNVILTPTLQPFFAATYLPPYSSPGLMGLVDLIGQIHQLWDSEEREHILQQAETITQAFSENIIIEGESLPTTELVNATAEELFHLADPIHGGMKGSPKFPMGYHYDFLLCYYQSQKDTRALFLVERTLDMIRRGGIYDQLGGGISRYSVDDAWHIPHFEKMLYDNAIMAHSYLQAWLLMRHPLYQETCRSILDYLLREMCSPEGGFYCAKDADLNGIEGLYYTWTQQEIMESLGTEGALFCQFYHVSPGGNFHGRNVLYSTLTPEEFALQHQLNPQTWLAQLQSLQAKLLAVRQNRPSPNLDDKILTGWNALTIFALIQAGIALNHAPYIEAAVKCARFLQAHLYEEGRLLRRWREGQALFAANLDEHAFLIRALLALFEANTGTEWLTWALELTETLEKGYKAPGGAFYQTDGSDSNIILRRCHLTDGSEPSGNSVHTENLFKLFLLTGNEQYRESAEDVLKAVKEVMEEHPMSYCYQAMNIDRYYSKKSYQIIVALNSQREWEKEIREALYNRFIPYKALVWQTGDMELQELLPDLYDKEAVKDQTTLYVCENGVCTPPCSSLPEILALIDQIET